MAEPLLVVESAQDALEAPPNLRSADADDYLSNPEFGKRGRFHLINLCRSYRYQSVGYYVSLLAEARGHRVIPSVRTIQDLSRKSLYDFGVSALDEALRRHKPSINLDDGRLHLPVFFGRTRVEGFEEVARRAFETFPCPLLELELRFAGTPNVVGIRSVSPRSLNPEQRSGLGEALEQYLTRRWRRSNNPRNYRFDLAILVNPEDSSPPSDAIALRRFAAAGRLLGLDVEIIRPRDLGRLAEFDALFIRETTRLNHHSYRFARKAEQQGIVVIDDPVSILRCTNKVYLAELLAANKIPTPKTRIYHSDNLNQAGEDLGYPLVLKMPESAFSKGVFKADTEQELAQYAPRLFKDSELVLAQEFLPTEFDWRIGLLNRKPLYACQYLMARKHWQVVKHGEDGKFREGGWHTLAVEDAPSEVVETAVRAANLIGDGLYGVDLKQVQGKVVVIEVNDNPSIEATVEDAVLKKGLYTAIMQEFLRRLEALRGVAPTNAAATR